MDSYANFAYSRVSVAPSPPTTGLTLSVTAGDGAVYPPPPFNVVVCPAGTLPLRTNAEILRVSAVLGDQLTFTRTQEGSASRAIGVGDQIYQGITEKMIDDLFAAMTPGPVGPPGPQGIQGIPGPTGPPGPSTAVGDATYWTATAHAGLTNEIVLSALANGYVKSTAGVPSTVAKIPVEDGGTGAGSVAEARTALGLGTMATQNANNVVITAGLIQGAIYIQTSYNVDTTAGMSAYGITSYAGITASGTITGGALVSNGNINAVGGVGANYFSGDGQNLTNLNASQLTHGTVPFARLPVSDIFPSGLMVFYDGPCPPGWTRVGLDGLFLRVGTPTGSPGGAATHTHGAGTYAAQDHQHGPGNYHANSHAHGGGVSVSVNGTAGAAGAHSHGYGGTISGTTGFENAGSMDVDAGNSGHMARNSHGHGFAANYAGTTDPVGDHTHSVSASGSGAIAPDEPVVWGNSSLAGAAAIVGASAAASHLPPYFDMNLCRKN